LKKTTYLIKENSWLAKIASLKLNSNSVAMVLGKTIHLHNSTSEEFLQNKRWFKHELCHIQQFKQYGYVCFIFKYLWESLKKGYKNNKYEVEARKAEEL
jgi:hypothetical protein